MHQLLMEFGFVRLELINFVRSVSVHVLLYECITIYVRVSFIVSSSCANLLLPKVSRNLLFNLQAKQKNIATSIEICPILRSYCEIAILASN